VGRGRGLGSELPLQERDAQGRRTFNAIFAIRDDHGLMEKTKQEREFSLCLGPTATKNESWTFSALMRISLSDAK